MEKKILIAYMACLLLIQRGVYAMRTLEHNKPKEISAIADSLLWKDFLGMDFKKKKLPKHLANADLTNANFSGHHFSATNITNAQLKGVVLTNTTCDYETFFEHNARANNMCYGGEWYLMHLPEDIKSITKVYPMLSEDSQKAKLLQIVSNLAYSPFYKQTEFYIKIQYWSCKLFLLKNQLRKDIGQNITCSMAENIKWDVDRFCWTTAYPIHLAQPKGMEIALNWCALSLSKELPEELGQLIQNYITGPKQALSPHFDRYLALFQAGLVNYNVKSKSIQGYQWYKKKIEQNIRGLGRAYPKLTSLILQEEAIEIAYQLSKSYQMEGWDFLLHFLACQNRLITLKRAAGIEEGQDIYYNRKAVIIF